MSQDHWNRIKALFAEAGELEPAEREDFVRERESDPDIVEAVLALLAHDDDAPLVSPLAARVGALEPGEMFGPYKVVRLIGQGGMGVIYQAERGDGQFQQNVAIKLLRSGPSGGQALVDAMREQRLLARLDHPNIARIIDAGIADSGQSFIVMDYVDGEDLIAYCRNRELDLDERLVLFRKICAAVSHAHRNLVLHRDLKPDNILVTDDAQPRLVDFGVARLLERAGGTTEPSTATIRGWTALTPEYASPEQIRGEPLTTATDIYALGVTLYELLTGERPFRFASRSPEEIVRTVTEAPVVPPSQRAGANDRAPVTARLLRGDLDMITAQAMHRDPERRYASAQALADDLDRFVRGLPIAARADSIGYRIRKFVRRQRLPVGVTAVASLLVLGSLGIAWTNHLVRLQEAERAQSLSRFMLRMFDSVTPTERQGESFTVTRLLDVGTDRALRELQGEPNVLRQVLLKIVDTHIALGNVERAQSTLDQLSAVPGSGSMRDPNAVEALYHQARLHDLRGESESAVAVFRRALDRLGEHAPDDPNRRAEIQTGLARALRINGTPQHAEQLLQDAIDLFAQPPAADPRAAQDELATLYYDRGELAAARDMHLAVIDSSERWDEGRDSMILAGNHNAAALTLVQLGEIEAAFQHNSMALEITERLGGRTHLAYSEMLGLQAYILHILERYEQALAATEVAIENLADEHRASNAYRQALGQRADILKNMGRIEESIAGFTELIEAWQNSSDSDAHWRQVLAGLSLGHAQYLGGHFRESLATTERNLETLEDSTLPDDSRHRYNLELRLQAQAVQNLVALGQFERAARRAEATLRTHAETDDGDARQLGARYILALWHGAAYERLGRIEEAQARFARARQIKSLVQPGMIAGERDMLETYQATGSPLPPNDGDSIPAQSESD